MNNDLKLNINVSTSELNMGVDTGNREIDPIFRNSPAYTITEEDIISWDNKSDFSGNYNDLTNKPTIPSKVSDLNNDSGFITKSVNDLTNYTLSSSLATVATTGQYSDLTGTPSLATVATTGSYNDLLDKPSGLTLDSAVSTTSTNGVENQAITNYVNNRTDYSTTETVIGTFLSKPLYRKVFNITGFSSSNTDYVSVSSLNISTLVHLYGFYKNSNGTFSIPFYDSDSNYSVIFLSSGGYIRGRFGNATSITEAKVIIEYTKTTD